MTTPAEVWRPGDRRDFAGPALIDTHIWLWYLDGAHKKISSDTIRLLKRCVKGEGLRVSDISVWEVGTKAAKGKLTLLPNVALWVARAGPRPGLSFLALDRNILLYSTQLPAAHSDPADRMLIASATLAELPLITADRTIIDYACEEAGFSVCDARP